MPPVTSASSADGVAGLAADLVAEYARRGWTLATAESLTAGLVAARVADVPGASAVLRGGIVAYATGLKGALLGVDPDLLARVGAVDPDVARAMAQGARERLDATVGVATTGVAGPDSQDGHPPGVVWVAVATPEGVSARRVPIDPDAGGADPGERRAAIRRATVAEALSDALAVVDGSPGE